MFFFVNIKHIRTFANNMSTTIVLKCRQEQPNQMAVSEHEEIRQTPMNAIVLDPFYQLLTENTLGVVFTDEFGRTVFVSSNVEQVIDDIVDVGLQLHETPLKMAIPFEIIDDIIKIKQNVFCLQTLKQLSLLKKPPYFQSIFEQRFWNRQLAMALEIVHDSNVSRIFETLKCIFFTHEDMRKSTHFNVITNFIYLIHTLKTHVHDKST